MRRGFLLYNYIIFKNENFVLKYLQYSEYQTTTGSRKRAKTAPNLFFFNKNRNNTAIAVDFIFNLYTKYENVTSNVFIYVENLTIFSLLMLEALPATKKYTLKMSVKNLEFNYLSISYNNLIFTFVCFTKLWPAALDNLAALCELSPFVILPTTAECSLSKNQQKLLKTHCKINYNVSKNPIFLQKNEFFETVTNYNMRIFQKIFFFFETFLKKFEDAPHICKIITLPSFVVKYFFKKQNSYKIANRVHQTVDNYVRQSYFGGRCEVLGNPAELEPIFFLDFKGMYSQIMEENFPICTDLIAKNLNLVFNKQTINAPGFYDISYEAVNMYFPVLPHKDSNSGKLLFCNGKNRGIF